MAALYHVDVQVAVVVGATRLSIREILKLGRGAIIPLDGDCEQLSVLQANGKPIGRGRVQVAGERLSLEVVEMIGAGS